MKTVATLAATLLALACVLPTDACGCPPALGVGTVFGVVARADGEAAPGAEVRVEARLFGCASAEPNALVDPPTTRTDAAGRYRYELRAISPSDTACLRLVARAAPERSDSAVAAGGRMRLVPSYGTRVRPESLRIDLRLP
jgi:hypothetical protein